MHLRIFVFFAYIPHVFQFFMSFFWESETEEDAEKGEYVDGVEGCIENGMCAEHEDGERSGKEERIDFWEFSKTKCGNKEPCCPTDRAK